MPPRRAKKAVAPKAQSSSDAESEHEAPAQSLTSKLTSKFKTIVGLETEEPKPASTASKRKRASLATTHDDEAEATSKATPGKKPRAKKSIEKPTSVKPPPKRPRKSVAAVAKEPSESGSDDEEQVAVTTPAKTSARKPRTKQSALKKTGQNSTSVTKKPRKSVAAAVVAEEDPTSESEDELATAPVSPVKPRAKGKAKATAPRRSPRKSAPASEKKSVTTTARKKRKAQDEYDSSIRELSHDSDSATPSETDDHDLDNYDPKREIDKEKLDDSEEEEEAALETMEIDSEALDDESDFGPHKIAERASASPVKKRGGNSEKAKGRKSVTQSGKKSTGKRAKKEATSEEEYESDQSGTITVGKIVKAPQTGHVPPGQISQNTFDFLLNLQDPAKNDREWFKLHDPVFRLAEKEWVAFVDAWVTELVEVDDEVPPLPPKDVIHRIYRDVRFSNDKTPYKRNFSASTSRSGRKGIFAGYHISIKPGGESMVAAGTWCPGKDELHCIRNVIKRNHARRLRQIIAEPSFVKLFGEPKPVVTKGKNKEPFRQSIFGREDELKVAPAGVKKDHPDIDLLKCRSFAVAYRFTDAQVLHKDFLEKTLKPVLVQMRPFVRCLNDYMTLPLDEMSEASSSSSSSDNEE